MGWEGINPPITDVPFKDELKRGYTDFSRFPKWVWLFEVSGGMLDKCMETTVLRLKGGPEIKYCRRAYLRITEDNNQHAVIALMRTKAKVINSAEDKWDVEYTQNFRMVALVPRFMGILHGVMGTYLLIFRDGKIEKAISQYPSVGRFTPKTIIDTINYYFPQPYHVIKRLGGELEIGHVLLSSIPKIEMDEMEPDAKDEIKKQLREIGIK